MDQTILTNIIYAEYKALINNKFFPVKNTCRYVCVCVCKRARALNNHA